MNIDLVDGADNRVNLMDKTIFLKYLKKYSSKHYNILPEALKASGGIIAGGGVLASYAGYNIYDLDIYINISNAMKFFTIYKDKGNDLLPHIFDYRTVLVNAYDKSFFRKNGVLARFPFYKDGRLDIILIKDNVNPTDVARNFDLSFCEIWYDGENVYAVDPEGIMNKTGRLKEDYQEALFKYHNNFILERLKKYHKRGFKIDIGNNNPLEILEINPYTEKNKKEISNKEEFAVKKIYKEVVPLISRIKNIRNIEIISKVPLNTFTINELKKVIRNLRKEYNIKPSVEFIYKTAIYYTGILGWPRHKYDKKGNKLPSCANMIFDIIEYSREDIGKIASNNNLLDISLWTGESIEEFDQGMDSDSEMPIIPKKYDTDIEIPTPKINEKSDSDSDSDNSNDDIPIYDLV